MREIALRYLSASFVVLVLAFTLASAVKAEPKDWSTMTEKEKAAEVQQTADRYGFIKSVLLAIPLGDIPPVSPYQRPGVKLMLPPAVMYYYLTATNDSRVLRVHVEEYQGDELVRGYDDEFTLNREASWYMRNRIMNVPAYLFIQAYGEDHVFLLSHLPGSSDRWDSTLLHLTYLWSFEITPTKRKYR